MDRFRMERRRPRPGWEDELGIQTTRRGHRVSQYSFAFKADFKGIVVPSRLLANSKSPHKPGSAEETTAYSVNPFWARASASGKSAIPVFIFRIPNFR